MSQCTKKIFVTERTVLLAASEHLARCKNPKII